jgi:multiple sugar transport system substrate-binding protein
VCPAAQAYQKAHPNIKLNIVTYDGDANGSNTLQTKVDLYNRTGSGWHKFQSFCRTGRGARSPAGTRAHGGVAGPGHFPRPCSGS